MTESVARGVLSVVAHLEDLRLPHIRFKGFAQAVCIGIPLAVLLRDASSLWMPSSFQLPIVSWFKRRWTSDESLISDLQTARNILIFFIVVVLSMNSDVAAVDMPADYLERRLINSNAVRAVNNQIYNARSTALETAGSVVQEEEVNTTGAQQQRDAALRRRFLRQSHSP